MTDTPEKLVRKQNSEEAPTRRENPYSPRRPPRRRFYCRALPTEGIAQSIYYSWSKDFLEAGKPRLAGDTKREANSYEANELRKESS